MSGNEVINNAFLQWREHLARVVSRIVPPHEIEDIVQETYVRACQYKTENEIKAPGAFMTRIARNLAIDHIKRAESRLTSYINDELLEAEREERSRCEEPVNQAASRQEFAIFCEAVRQLPVQCRRVFVLKKVYGYSQREIATKLNISENTVEKHVAQGIKRCMLYMRQHNESREIKPQIDRPVSMERKIR